MRNPLYWIVFVFFIPITLRAQFSPGQLSKYHADLEGTANCIQCHEVGKKALSNGCLLCHSPLKNRIDAGSGFHAELNSDCGNCHSDHNGSDFELIYWPDGITRFDHNKTGYILSGKHSGLTCDQCHTRKLIKSEDIIDWANDKSSFPVLDRTFLGLDTACISCHQDVHREEVSNDCKTCHAEKGWELARKAFDHNTAKFQLTGAHKTLECNQCHQNHKDWQPIVPQLTGLSFNNCTSCHKDYHQGSYGSSCQTCHSTTNWKKDLKEFIHENTRYPLVGKHKDLTCVTCHTKELIGTMPKYSNCMDCHSDRHFAQFSKRLDRGECASCHTVNGFIPTTFTPDRHQSIRFILQGAHQAVPCNACHIQYEPVNGAGTTRFIWESIACSICHKDKHRNQFAKFDNSDCSVCHTSWSFQISEFDHQKTAFQLDGKHKNVPCDRCHTSEEDIDGKFVRYYPVPHRCVDCHTLNVIP